jgi:non-canonical poly(A) RNA polymerase PAPD5/7
MTLNTRSSLLGPLVGSSFMLDLEHRKKLRSCGYTLNRDMDLSLAATAKAIREGYSVTTEQSVEETEKARLAREAGDTERQRLTEERNKKLSAEAERTAVLEHGDAMASILGMPSVQHDESSGEERATLEGSTQETLSEAKRESSETLPAQEANSDAEKRSIDATLADRQPEK